MARRRRGEVAQRRVEQLGDSEVEQLHPPLAVDQDVRRLQVAVDDEPLVGVLHRRADVQEELEAALEVEPASGAELGDRRAVDVLHDQVRIANLVDAGVEDLRDVRMRERCQHAALGAEAVAQLFAQPAARRRNA